MNPRSDFLMSPRAPVLSMVPSRWLSTMACVLVVVCMGASHVDAKKPRRRRRGKNKPVATQPQETNTPVSTTPDAADAPADPTLEGSGPTPKAKVEEKDTKGGKVQNFDFTGIELGATMRTPQLLYFLDRANEELKRASLERRSFVPEMVRSIAEERL